MMKYRVVVASLIGSSLFLADAAYAQWLNPTLDAQRMDNLRRHQQRQREKAADKHKQAEPKASVRTLTRQERQAAWAIHEAEYKRRAARDGYVSADRWFVEQAHALRNRR